MSPRALALGVSAFAILTTGAIAHAQDAPPHTPPPTDSASPAPTDGERRVPPARGEREFRRPDRDAIRERMRQAEPSEHHPGERPQGSPPDMGWLQRFEARPDLLRDRLARRLVDMRRQESQLESAIARLEEGASPRETIRALLRAGIGPQAFEGPAPEGAQGLSEDDLRTFAHRTMPALHERLEQLARSPEAERGPAARRVLNQLRPRLEELYQLEREDEELFELKKRELLTGVLVIDATRRIALSVEQWDEATRQGARRRLRAAIEASFDARHEVLAHEVRELESRLAAMREELEAQNGRREELIDQRTEFLFEQAQRNVPDAGPSRPERED